MWNENSPWPSDMLGYYKKIKLKAAGTPVTISVNRYRNNDPSSHPSAEQAGTQDAIKLKDALLSLNMSNVLSRAGGANNYVNVFTGKGSPEAIGAVLSTLADYEEKFVKKFGGLSYENNYALKLTADLLGDSSLSWQDTLQAICDEFIGLDCNGFVGNWLLKCDSSLKLNEQSGPGTVRGKGKVKRMHLKDIEEWDVAIWPGNIHIAAIERPGSSDSKFWMCQSAGDGPSNQEYVLTESAPGIFTKTGGANPKSEVGGNVEIYSLW
ncbi:hypothetical protein ACH50O_11355 [Methylomonas sp. 2BW1-5-20]|uniref:hypothetical protein n=1 Tax=Methylomonas sp. 2BW1-5-20 TaxID=3376686 RepID=UPI00404D00E2